jgi:hypothetical protein
LAETPTFQSLLAAGTDFPSILAFHICRTFMDGFGVSLPAIVATEKSLSYPILAFETGQGAVLKSRGRRDA